MNEFTEEDFIKARGLEKRYAEELGKKSPFFRAKYGDWRANDNTKVNVAKEKGSERGTVTNTDTGWDIQVSGKVFSETKTHRNDYNLEAREYLDYINSIVKNAILLDSHAIPAKKAKSQNSAMMHSLYAFADIGNGVEVIKLYVEELRNAATDGHIRRSYQLQNITKASAASTRVQAESLSPFANTADADGYSVAQLFDIVKHSDKNFNPNDINNIRSIGRSKVTFQWNSRTANPDTSYGGNIPQSRRKVNTESGNDFDRRRNEYDIAERYRRSGMAEVLKKLGYTLAFTDEPEIAGMVDKDSKTVYVGAKYVNAWRVIAKHELTHILEDTDKYGEFVKMMKSEMSTAWKVAKERVKGRYERANAARAASGEKGFTLDEQTLEAETAAELGEVLKTDRFIRNFAVGENMPFAMKTIEFARTAAKRLQSKVSGANGWDNAARLWGQALEDVKADTQGSGKWYYTHVDDEGNRITVITDNQGLFAGLNPKEASKTAAQLLNERYKNKVIPLSDYGLIHVNKTGINKYLHSTKADENAHLNKLKAAGEFENLLLNAEYLKSTNDKKDHSFAKYGFDHYRTIFAIDGQVFEGIIDVGVSEKGAEFYGMTNIKRVTGINDGKYFDPLSSYKSAFSDNSINNRIAQNELSVNSNIRKSNENNTFRRNKIADESERSSGVQEKFGVDDAKAEILQKFGITNLKDYIEVQRKVFNYLQQSGFFTDEGGRSRTVINADSGMQIEINKSGINETFGNGPRYERKGTRKKIAKILTIEKLPVIIESGKLIADNEDNYHTTDSNVKYAYIEKQIGSGENAVIVKVDIKKTANKNKFWVHQVEFDTKKSSANL